MKVVVAAVLFMALVAVVDIILPHLRDELPDRKVVRYIDCGDGWAELTVGAKQRGVRYCRVTTATGDVHFEASTLALAERKARIMRRGEQ